MVVHGGAVAPLGNSTKSGYGNPLSREVTPISTRKLNRVLAYEPDDMTISVEAGATIGAVWNELSPRGQTIPIDVATPESETIGGLIATGLCGARRYGSGSLRDALIGIQVAYPDGTLGNAGGMVVKNVSGFDLMRMHLGAVGTLGVIVSANFKVVPSARGEATVLVERDSLDQLESDRLTVARGRIRPVSFEARRTGDGWLEAIRIEGRPATVDQMARELAGRLAGSRAIPADESAAFWAGYARGEALPNDGQALAVQISGRPTQVASTAARSIAVFESADVEFLDLRVSLGLGTVRCAAKVPEEKTDDVAGAIASLRASDMKVVLLSAPATVSRCVDAFGFAETTLELMRPLKRQFDPWSALNPGRVIPEL